MPLYNPTPTGSIVVTLPNRVMDPSDFAKTLIQIDWTADGAGNVTAKMGHRVNGEIASMVTDPRSVSSTYNVTINNTGGIDVFNGTATNRSTTVNEFLAAVANRSVVDDQLWINIIGAGAASTGTIWLYSKHY